MFHTDDRLEAKAHCLVLRSLKVAPQPHQNHRNHHSNPALDTYFYFHSSPHSGPGNEAYKRKKLKTLCKQ